MERKQHKRAIPLLGGLAIFISFFLVAFWYVVIGKTFLFGQGYIHIQHLLGIFFASALLMLGGFLDDKYNLSYRSQLFWTLLALFVLLGAGVEIRFITNPFGGVYRLDFWRFSGLNIFFPSAVFTMIWLFLMMYTTKLLDGLDGLVSGMTAIGSFFLFMVSLRSDLLQYDTAFLAIILFGACLGFLLWNFHPAKIFLGEGGALWCGFMLGVLSIVAGGKITTALLVMGLPLLDLIWVVLRRGLCEGKSPLKHSDRKHLHFRLLSAGLSHRQAVFFFYAISFIFGGSVLFIQGRQKLIALGLLGLVMFIVAILVVVKTEKSS